MDRSVSVIIPTYNRQEFLAKAVESVLKQTWPDIELIVVDDGSTDDTAAMLRARFPAVRYLYQENQGAAAARNTGIKAACCDLIAFLDSDDRFHEKKIEVQTLAMINSPEYHISHTQEIWYRRGRILNQKQKHRKESGDIFQRSLELCAVGMSTIMVRRELFDRVGLFDESLPCCEDYDLWLRTSARYPFLLIDAPLTIKDGGRPDQLSSIHRIGMDKYRIQAIQKLLVSGILSEQQTALAAKYLTRKSKIYGNGCLKHGRTEEGEKYLALVRRYGTC